MISSSLVFQKFFLGFLLLLLSVFEWLPLSRPSFRRYFSRKRRISSSRNDLKNHFPFFFTKLHSSPRFLLSKRFPKSSSLLPNITKLRTSSRNNFFSRKDFKNLLLFFLTLRSYVPKPIKNELFFFFFFFFPFFLHQTFQDTSQN